jgi:two-component system sensor histidine kinase BaeS
MILIAGVAVISLAALLFVNAMSISDFSPPGQDFLSGRSDLRLAAAFLLLTGLALAQLFVLFRTGRSRGGAPGSRATRVRENAAAASAPAPEGAARAGDAPDVNAYASGGIQSETAGELRTSVDVIQEELGEILEDEMPADDKERMHVLYEETDRLKKIIAGMEQLSQAQAIARVLRKEPVQIEPLLAGIIEQTRLAAAGKDVAYTLQCEPGLVMQGDPECIGRIIGNIADNAARFIRDSGSVALTAGRRGGLVVFSVTDTGTGIRRAHLPHIYEHFFRGAGSGIGMGLSIAKELVDACGGKIDVQTSAGKGTTVIVELPGE